MRKTLSQKDKDQIYLSLATSYIELVKKGTIGKYERKVVSRKILDAVDKAQTYEDVYLFLSTLTKLYPDFTFAMTTVKGEISKTHEQHVMSHLQSFLKTASK